MELSDTKVHARGLYQTGQAAEQGASSLSFSSGLPSQRPGLLCYTLSCTGMRLHSCSVAGRRTGR
jgi:hypothetical protein